jgi:hypothetical protein
MLRLLSTHWMPRPLHRMKPVVAMMAFAMLLTPYSTAAAQSSSDDEDEGITLFAEGTRPLATVTFASANRFVDEARYIFDVAGSPESFEIVEGWLADALNNLEGFNRDKPFGIMVYLPIAIPPLPEFIAYVPVDSIEDAQKLIEKAPVVVRKDSEEGRYEIIGPRRTTPLLIRDGYAFFPLGNSPSPEILDREIPDPEKLVAAQAKQFDASVSLDVESIPPGTRTLITTLLTSGISTQLQQRDEEPEGAYRMRRAEGERSLEAIKQLLDECQKVTFGLDIVQEEQAVNIDFVFDVRSGTKLLEDIFASTTKPSYFIPLLDDTAAVSLSMSQVMAERDRKAYIEILDGLKMEIVRQIEVNKLGAVPDEEGAIGQGLSALQRTLEEGHMDVFAQFYRDSDDKLAIIGAVRVLDGEDVSLGLQDVLSRLGNIDDFKNAGDLRIGSGQHVGVTFHSLTFNQTPAEAEEIFGKEIGITLGCGGNSAWFCIGGEGGYATLTSVMDKLEEAVQTPSERANPPNFRMIFNVNQLVEMVMSAESVGRERREAEKAEQIALATAESAVAEAASGKPALSESAPKEQSGNRGRRARGNRVDGGKIFRDTLAEGDDRVEIDFRLTESGGRTRIRLEEGFVKIFGRLIAANFSSREVTDSSE